MSKTLREALSEFNAKRQSGPDTEDERVTNPGPAVSGGLSIDDVLSKEKEALKKTSNTKANPVTVQENIHAPSAKAGVTFEKPYHKPGPTVQHVVTANPALPKVTHERLEKKPGIIQNLIQSAPVRRETVQILPQQKRSLPAVTFEKVQGKVGPTVTFAEKKQEEKAALLPLTGEQLHEQVLGDTIFYWCDQCKHGPTTKPLPGPKDFKRLVSGYRSEFMAKHEHE